MTTALMTGYILVWPALAGLVLIQITVGVLKDHRDARKEGRKVV